MKKFTISQPCLHRSTRSERHGSSGSAGCYHFHIVGKLVGTHRESGVGTSITGTVQNKHAFSTTHGVVKCNNVSFSGTAGAPEGVEQEFTANYTGCTLAGISATVNMTSCSYLFRIVGEEVLTDVKCSTAGDHIDISVTGSTCQLTIPPQTGLKGVTLDSSGTETAMDVLATLDITGIRYQVDNPTTCPNPSDVTEMSDGTYQGGSTIQANVVTVD